MPAVLAPLAPVCAWDNEIGVAGKAFGVQGEKAEFKTIYVQHSLNQTKLIFCNTKSNKCKSKLRNI